MGREDDHARLVESLRDPARHPGRPARVELIETHISSLLLAGDRVLKLKKPVDLGFLDFSTLEARRRCCEEELRLNRRTAPSLYLDVVAITGMPDDPQVGGDGPPLDYAVRMRRFPQEALLDRMARAGRLEPAHLDALAQRLEAFHRSLEPAGMDSPWATPAQVLAAALQNFEQIRQASGAAADESALGPLERWTLEAHAALTPAFEARRRGGFVRECHGDLHLGNIVLIDGEPTPFDGIEFNPGFRWIDVMNEVAFLVMDLEEHRLPGLAYRFLNRYLEAGGDYAGLRVLRFYLVYRAMVRAKVACIRAQQRGIASDAADRAREDTGRYLDYANGIARGARRALLLMHGLSGSGKTTIARQLAGSLRAICLRSDVERKRLHGLAADQRSASAPGGGIYAAGDNDRTYERLATLAREALAAGWPVIVDAAFLDAKRRAAFVALAREAGAPCAIAACTAPEALLRERIAARERAGSDASEAGLAVLRLQQASAVPLSAAERAFAVKIDSERFARAPGAATAALAARLGLSSPAD